MNATKLDTKMHARTQPRHCPLPLRRWEYKIGAGMLIERMVGHVSKEERELQIIIVRALLYIILPLCIVLGSVEYLTTQTVNPFLLSIGSAISGAIVAMLKAGGKHSEEPSHIEPHEPEQVEAMRTEQRGGGLKIKRPQ